jgi:hypothetical protein
MKHNRTELESQTQVDARIDELAERWADWLDCLSPRDAQFMIRMVAALPGADEVADLVFDGEPVTLGWREWQLMHELLDTVNDPGDVARFCRKLINRNTEEEEQ